LAASVIPVEPFYKENEMPKMKTKSGAKKRFKVTGKGRVKFKAAYMRHMQMNKPKSMKRKARGTDHLTEMDAKVVLDNFLPYKRRNGPKGPKRKATAEATAKKGAK
jgi:large subunit ribosomal protein L35